MLLLSLFGATGCHGAKDSDSPEPDSPDPEELAWTLVGEHPNAALMGVSGRSPTDIVTVGADDGTGGLILRYDGTSWSRVDNTDLHDLWWVAAMDNGVTFAAGAGGTVLRDDGTGFVRLETPALGAQTIYGLWGDSPGNLWVVGGFAGRDGFLWHYDGTDWVDTPLPDDVPRGPDGDAPSLFKVWGHDQSDIWVVGTGGTILHYDGSAWTVVYSGTEEALFTVHGNDEGVVIVGAETVLLGDETSLVLDTPAGAGVLQGAFREPGGRVVVTGASGTAWELNDGEWMQNLNATGISPESLHSVYVDPDGGRWAVGGALLTGTLDAGAIVHLGADTVVPYTAPADPEPADATCPSDDVDPVPTGSMARRWNEQLLNSIRRDIPRPGVHARNLFHTSVAIWDAWAAYDTVADTVVADERIVIAGDAEREAARDVAISYAAYRVLNHRYADQTGGATSVACYDAFMAELGLDPTDEHVDGDDAVALGNRIGAAVIDRYADDGANEADSYTDTTGWLATNSPLVVDQPGTSASDPDEWQLLNLAAAETQNGIILDAGIQGYICSNWGLVEPWSLTDKIGEYTWLDAGNAPSVTDPEMKEWVMDVLRKHALHDADLTDTIDISPGAYGNNSLGENDGTGLALNPATGEPYAADVVKLGDFSRVLSEFWADGPKSETPPGHWNVLANTVSDDMEAAGTPFQIGGAGEDLDRLGWDAHLYLALNGAVHDAAIVAWGVKREQLGPRPITLVRWMGQQGQSSDASLASYSPDGLPLEDGVVELITEESAAPGERHYALRWYIGEVAVYSWRGEPGDRENQSSGVGWMRAKDWFPYQRRTFVTPAFPGFISGHSTFSRAAAEVLTSYTGSPYFPGGLGSYTAEAGTYLVFEDGPSETVQLQWATFQDAADQAGQSRVYGGIHIWPDDQLGRQLGYDVGHMSYDAAIPYWDGSARAD